MNDNETKLAEPASIWEGPVLMDYNIAAEFDTPQAATAWFNRVSRSIKRRPEQTTPVPTWLVTKITKAGRFITIRSEDKLEQSRLEELLKAVGARIDSSLYLNPWYIFGWCWKCTLRIKNNFSVDTPIASVLDQLAFILPREADTISWIRKSQASIVKATPNRLVFDVLSTGPPPPVAEDDLSPQALQRSKQWASRWTIKEGAVVFFYRCAPSSEALAAQTRGSILEFTTC